MSYPDDPHSPLALQPPSDPCPPSCDGGVNAVTPSDHTTLETVRAQLDEDSIYFLEDPVGTFVSNGTRHGCGFATIAVTVDEEAGTATFDVATHQRVSPRSARSARRLMRMVNNTLIQTGLELSEDGTAHFIPERPLDVRGGENVGVAVGRALTTVHDTAWKLTALEAGVKPWKLI